MNLKVECPERYPDNVTGVAWRYPDDVTTGTKLGKSTWPQLETRLKGALCNCDTEFFFTTETLISGAIFSNFPPHSRFFF